MTRNNGSLLPHGAQDLLISAVRCWRRARDRGLPTQPSLARAQGGAMLAPALDSLCQLYQLALGRPYCVGRAAAFSADERRLVGLFDGSLPRHLCLDCSEGAATALDCALCSTRILLAFAVPARAP